jgi:hypothetical protein
MGFEQPGKRGDGITVFTVQKVNGQSAALGVVPGDEMISLGGHELGAGMSKADVVKLIQVCPRPLAVVFRAGNASTYT